jgi:L-malate glycosyltransferase
VSHSYPPVPGGSEIEAQRVAAALIARGHQVTVVCCGGPPMPPVGRWVDPSGVPVRIFARRGSRVWRDRVFALGVVWTLWTERRHYQLVYFLMQGLHLAAGLPVAKLLSKPVVMKVSGSNIITLMQNSWLGRLELRWLRQWSRRVMILNPGIAEEAARAGFRPEQLLWMPNPVDVGAFAPCGKEERSRLRAEAGLTGASPVVLYVGRLAPEKALPSLIDAFACVVERFPEALLALVGDGGERAALRDRAAGLGLSRNIRFTGFVETTEVRRWLQLADVFTLVSSFEGFPCSLIEAMATGLPSVVSGIPGNTQLIEAGVNGLIVEQGNSEAIAHALAKLLDDPDLSARMGLAARQVVVDRYSTGRVVDRYEALFREALGL